jgi:hypothetical protein
MRLNPEDIGPNVIFSFTTVKMCDMSAALMNGYHHSDIGGRLTTLGGCVAAVVHCSRKNIGLSPIRETIQRDGTKSSPSFVACGQFRLCL